MKLPNTISACSFWKRDLWGRENKFEFMWNKWIKTICNRKKNDQFNKRKSGSEFEINKQTQEKTRKEERNDKKETDNKSFFFWGSAEGRGENNFFCYFSAFFFVLFHSFLIF